MNEIRKDELYNDVKKTKRCSRCGRELPLERFSTGNSWCKDCCSSYLSERNGTLTEEKKVRIERIYKEPLPERLLDASNTNVKLLNDEECFVKLIDYRNAWVSNYGRVLECKNGRFVVKRTKRNELNEKVCVLQKNVYNGGKWIWKKQTIEIWRLVVRCFIQNFDFAGNTRCWHKNNDLNDNYYKHIYPVGEKQHAALLDKYNGGQEITEELILDVINDILYKADDWSTNKWKRTVFDIGYLGCADSEATRNNYIYSKWQNMMQRCYDPKTQEMKPYYKGCGVDVELLNYSNYREWHKENCMDDNKLDLDKDILVEGNKVYSVDTVTLVPHFTNTVFVERGFDANITYNSEKDIYNAYMNIIGKRNHIGEYDTEEEAKQAYIDYKQNYIRDFAEKNKGKVPNKTYEAMKNWVVEVA